MSYACETELNCFFIFSIFCVCAVSVDCESGDGVLWDGAVGAGAGAGVGATVMLSIIRSDPRLTPSVCSINCKFPVKAFLIIFS